MNIVPAGVDAIIWKVEKKNVVKFHEHDSGEKRHEERDAEV